MTLRRISTLLVVATLLLLAIGGTVRPTGSSLACPDWPTCYGSFFPEMTGGVEYEHTHRIGGTVVGLLTLAVVALAYRGRREDAVSWRLALASLGMVLVQGLLGGATVLLRLPPPVSTAHLVLSMLFTSTVTVIAWRARGRHRLRVERSRAQLSLSQLRVARAAWVLVFAQITLGALVRHLGAGPVCLGRFPLCGEEWLPAHEGAALHVAHRAVAVLCVVVVFALASITQRPELRAAAPLARTASMGAVGLVLVQFLLGVWTVVSMIHFIPAAAHTAIAGALLCVLTLSWLESLPPRPARHPHAAGICAETA